MGGKFTRSPCTEDTLKRFAVRVVFIGGGPPVWDAYARWSRAEKERLVAATFEPCVTVSEDSQYRVPATSTDLRLLQNFS